MMKYIYILLVLSFVFSCDSQGVKKEPQSTDLIEDTVRVVEKPIIEAPESVVDSKKLANGIEINWHEHGTGTNLDKGDVIYIDYKVRLTDSTIVDGNHLLKKDSFPFMVGFKMQTTGWDIALKELKVGDFATILIPSELARGKKGIAGLIPPNADNVLTIKVLSRATPSREVDGNKVWILEENKQNKEKFGEDNQIVFHAMVSSESSPLYFNSFRSNQPFELKLEDNGVVPGLKKALINAKKADRMFVYVPASEAYGAKGYQKLVKPNEALFYNVLVMDVLEK